MKADQPGSDQPKSSLAVTRDRLVRIALDLIVREGFLAVSAPRLAAEAGISRPAVYYHVQDIDDLLFRAVELSHLETMARVEADLLERAPAEVIWRLFYGPVVPLTEFITLALRKKGFADLYRRVVSDMRQVLAVALEKHYRQRNVPPPLDIESIVFLLQMVSHSLSVDDALGLSLRSGDIERFLFRTFALTVAAPAHEGASEPPAGPVPTE